MPSQIARAGRFKNCAAVLPAFIIGLPVSNHLAAGALLLRQHALGGRHA
jgi:hypothetical protein